ncbi:MAG: class II fructose-bisphosphate aldolase, partial [Acidobacteriota bacterium]
MPLSLREMRENCQKARDAVQRAREGHYALGAFNLDNQETLIAVARAAKAKNAPLMVEVSQGEV